MVHLLHVQSIALMDTIYLPYLKFCMAIIMFKKYFLLSYIWNFAVILQFSNLDSSPFPQPSPLGLQYFTNENFFYILVHEIQFQGCCHVACCLFSPQHMHGQFCFTFVVSTSQPLLQLISRKFTLIYAPSCRKCVLVTNHTSFNSKLVTMPCSLCYNVWWVGIHRIKYSTN